MLIQEKVDLWRERFYGRQDVFAIKETYFNQKENRNVSDYIPVYRDRETKSGETPEERYLPLGDNHIESHLKGYMELMIYVLHVNRMIKFGAIDFDRAHTFEDALKCKRAINEAGFPCYIARSTKKGYHLYLFFNTPIEGKYVTSYIRQVYTEIGFMTDLYDSGRALPETFPKTLALRSPLSTGYGIKPPMWGKGMSEDRNCWVDDYDQPIGGRGPAEEQWDFMAQMEVIDSEKFVKYLEDSKIEIDEVRISEKRGAVPQADYKRGSQYVQPKDGDLNRIIQGCPAIKRIWEGPTGDMPHHAVVAVLSWALQTANGLDIIRERYQNSKICDQQIRYAIETCQQPWTCKAVQEHGICLKGKDPRFATIMNGPLDHCFKKSPPKEIVNGKVVINPEKLPESEWSDPSPVRLRLEPKKINADEIRTEIEELSKDDPDLGTKISAICSKLLYLKDVRQRSELENLIASKKVIKKTEFKELSKEAKAINKEEAVVNMEANNEIVWKLGVAYTRIRPCGYGVVEIDKDGNEITRPISDFEIEWTKNVTLHTILKGNQSEIKGHIITEKKKMPFVVPAETMYDNNQFKKLLGRFGSVHLAFESTKLDKIRIAATAFGKRTLVDETFYEDYGFDSYETPTVYRSAKWNITASGYSCEHQSCVDLTKTGFAKDLCIEKISNEDFAKAVFHIKNDLLNFNDPKVTYPTLAHTLQAAIQMAFFPFTKAPMLWIDGLTGSGKSALTDILQAFHGSFPRLMSVSATVKSVEYYSMIFKDAMLVIDDYKHKYHREWMIKLVQPAYDRAARGRLNGDLEQAAAPYCRGLMMTSAEDLPSSEASTLARMLIVNYAPTLKTTDGDDVVDRRYKTLMKTKHLFSGVTGRFIHYMLATYQNSKPELAERFLEYENLLKEPVKYAQNLHRVSQNLAANFLTWVLFCDFLLQENHLTKEEHTKLIDTHWNNMAFIRDRMIAMCKEEQASMIFVESIREIVASGMGKIEGIPTVNEFAPILGFVKEPGVVYLFPGMCITLVKKLLQSNETALSHSLSSIGTQLLHDGMLVASDSGKPKLKKTYRGQRVNVWGMITEKTGIGAQIVQLPDGESQPQLDEPTAASQQIPETDLSTI